MTTLINPRVIALVLPAIILVIFYSYAVWSAGFLLSFLLAEKARANGLLFSATLSPVALSPATVYVLGHAALSILLQLMALMGLIRWYILLPLLLGLILGAGLLQGLPPLPWQKLTVMRQTLIPQGLAAKGLAFSVVALVLLLAMVTFSMPGTDALAYYMAQPKLMAATGAYTLLPRYENFATLPAIAEMPYAVMYALGGSAIGFVAAKLSIWVVFIALLWLLWVLMRKLGASLTTTWMLMALVATSTAITLVTWDGKTDLIGLMYALTAILWLPGLLPQTATSHKPAWLSGCMAACAVMAKVSYLSILPFCLGLPLLLIWRKQPLVFLRLAGIACLSAIATLAVGWWLKNAVLFGDPFTPFLTFRETTPGFNLSQVWFDADSTRWILQTYPLALTFGNYPLQHGGLSPIWLILAPALLTKPWQTAHGKKALYIALGSIVGLFIWMTLRPSVIAPRYFFPVLIFPCCLLMLGLEQWLQQKRPWATAAIFASILVVMLNGYYLVSVAKITTLPLSKSISGVVGLTPLWDRAAALRKRASNNSRILLLSYSSEFLTQPMLASFTLLETPNQPLLSERALSLRDDETILDMALREKIDYIVYDTITHRRDDLDVTPPPGLNVEKLEYAKDVYYLYALKRQESTS